MLSKPNLIALIVASASFIQQIDSTIVATSLPQMAISLHANPVALGAAITSYALSLAVFMPVSGWLADRFGGSLVFRIAIVIFTLGSILCGVSTNITELIAARFLQGFGGAMMSPVGRLLVLRASQKSTFITAMAWLQVPGQLGPVIGLPLGGFITTYLSWRWNFFINIPIGVLGIVLVSIFIENEPADKSRPFDGVGFALSGIALLCIVHGLNLLGAIDGNLYVGAAFLAAGAMFAFFCVRHAAGHAHPLLDLSLLRIPTFSVNFFAGSLFRYGVDAIPFLLPLLFQLGFGMTAFGSGLLSLASAVGSVVMRAMAKPVLKRYGFRHVLIVNALISVVTVLVCALYTASTPITVIFVTLTIGGFFRALQFVALNTIAYADVPREKMSAATSFASMIQQLSNAIGVALAVIFLHVETGFRGIEVPTAFDLRLAFIAMAVISASSIPSYLALSRSAGSELSEHRGAKTASAEGQPRA
ncbi:MAG TPA: MFS transporter [Beijerinckiaceae bacterium]|nr:MFS transporter [Beijerinckiaceae bacterium]